LRLPLFIGFRLGAQLGRWRLAFPRFANRPKLFLPLAIGHTWCRRRCAPISACCAGALLLLGHEPRWSGLGFGPTFVGFVSDYFKTDAYPENSLQIRVLLRSCHFTFGGDACCSCLARKRALKREAATWRRSVKRLICKSCAAVASLCFAMRRAFAQDGRRL
jgi:hypothetical protein